MGHSRHTGNWVCRFSGSVRDYFTVGGEVRHTDPKRADWRGTVQPAWPHRHPDDWIRDDQFGQPLLRVKWHTGTDIPLWDDLWYSPGDIDPVK